MEHVIFTEGYYILYMFYNIQYWYYYIQYISYSHNLHS